MKIETENENKFEIADIRLVPGFENYGVDRFGNVWNIRRKNVLNPIENGRGYLRVRICNGDEQAQRLIHRLVAEVWIEKPEGWTPEWHVHHIDHNPYNNRVENLAWISQEEHRAEHGNAPKRVECVETGEVFDSVCAAARAYGLNQGNISNCCIGRKKHYGGHTWQFID